MGINTNIITKHCVYTTLSPQIPRKKRPDNYQDVILCVFTSATCKFLQAHKYTLNSYRRKRYQFCQQKARIY